MKLQKAIYLSVKKWKWIVDNNGSNNGLIVAMPELKNFSNNCAMCEYKNPKNFNGCIKCLLSSVCDNEYQNWAHNKNKENAIKVLEAIKKAVK
jgi:hypothetical protein